MPSYIMNKYENVEIICLQKDVICHMVGKTPDMLIDSLKDVIDNHVGDEWGTPVIEGWI